MKHSTVERIAGALAMIVVLAAAGCGAHQSSDPESVPTPDLEPPIQAAEPESVDTAEADCEVTELEGNPNGEGTQISDNGEYVIGTMDGERVSGTQDVLWRHGELDRSPDKPTSQINSDGASVGGAIDGTPQVYADGANRALPLPDSIDETTLDGLGSDQYSVEATDINDRGDVLGTATHDEETTEPDATEPDFRTWEVPVLWPADSDEPVVLEVDDGMSATTTGWAGDGRVVGAQGPPDDGTLTYWSPRIWNPDGTGETLPRMQLSSGEYVLPSDVSGDWVLSTDYVSGRGAAWRTSDPTDVRGQAEGFETAAIDADGRVYGTVGREVVRQDGDRLDTLPLLDSDDPLGSVADVTPDGTMATGYSFGDIDPDADWLTDHAVTWNCQ